MYLKVVIVSDPYDLWQLMYNPLHIIYRIHFINEDEMVITYVRYRTINEVPDKSSIPILCDNQLIGADGMTICCDNGDDDDDDNSDKDNENERIYFSLKSSSHIDWTHE